MKLASEARPSLHQKLDQVRILFPFVPFCNTEPTCMPLSGHFMDIEGQVLVYQVERYQLSLTYNASL